MKIRYVIFTIILIVVAHLVVLFICFHPSSDEKGKNVPDKTEVQPAGTPASVRPASAAVSPASNPAAGPASSAQSASAVKPAASGQQEPPRSYPPINYRFAWKGNIREIPASAGARGGVLLDADTGNVLWDKNAGTPVPIASMTKIMTLLLASEDITSGRNGISLESQVKISRATMKIGGSQVWLDVRETFKLEDLLRAVAIKSANDAAYQVAEFLGDGDVHGFVARMNRRARELGMKNTHFYNPHGLPGNSSSEDNVSSPADMALLAEYCLGHAKIMEWASMAKSDIRGGKTELVNHNNLLAGRRYPSPGVDGLKTGFINRSGYCVTITCKRAGKRMIAVIVGFDTAKNRDLFARKLLDWGYARADDPASANARSSKLAPVPEKKRTVKPAAKSKAPVKKKPAASSKKKKR